VPVSVGGLSGVIAIAAGETFSLALLSNGTVMAWGDNGEGQLGTGTSVGPQSCTSAAGEEPCSTSPVVVAGLRYTDVKGIAAGGSHSLAFGPPNPTVTGLSPNSGLVTGGTAVTITGTEFSGATAVHFGSAGATAFVVQSQTTITAVSPSGSGAVDVTVTTPEGTSPTGPADQFTYSLNAPAVAPSTSSSLGAPVSAQRLGTPAQVSNKPTLSHRAVANQATPTQSGAAAVASVTTPRIIGVNIHGFNEFGGEAAIKTILEGPIAPVKSLRVDTPGIAAKAASVRAGATGERQFEQMTCIVGNGLDVGGEAMEDPWRTAELEPPLRTAFEGSKKEQWEVATLKEVKQCAALPVAVIEITNEPWNLYLNGQRLNGYPQEEARFYGEMCLGLLSRVAESQERHELGPVKLLARANQNGGGREWLEAMFTIPEAAKLGEKLGGFAYHPYAKKASEAATSIKEMVRQEEFLHRPQYHVANPIFYVTEYGKVAKGKRKQAAETRRMFEILKQPSRAVQGIWYYDFADPGAPGDGWYPAPGGAIALSKPRPVKCVVEEFAKEEAKETTANGPCP
jgi:IPT/TIG domain/Regulator of chromosome condensation (RCC1) repeat